MKIWDENQETTYGYSQWGEVSTVVSATGKVELKSGWCPTNGDLPQCPSGSVYYETVISPAGQSSYKYFNKHSQILRTSKPAHNNSWIFEDYSYSARGLLEAKSYAYFEGTLLIEIFFE